MFPWRRRSIYFVSLSSLLYFTKVYHSEALLLPAATNSLRRSLSCHVQSPDNQVDGDDVSTAEQPSDEQEEAATKTIPPTSNNPSPQQVMTAMGTSPRRILLSFASATGIALAANFLGVTSRLLEVVPENTVESTGLDTYFPRGEYLFLFDGTSNTPSAHRFCTIMFCRSFQTIQGTRIYICDSKRMGGRYSSGIS